MACGAAHLGSTMCPFPSNATTSMRQWRPMIVRKDLKFDICPAGILCLSATNCEGVYKNGPEWYMALGPLPTVCS